MPDRTKITRVLILGFRAALILSSTASASAETLEQKQACIADAFAPVQFPTVTGCSAASSPIGT